MASTINPEILKSLREQAKSAVPYPSDHPMLRTFDGDATAEELARIDATIAKEILERNGYSVEDPADD